MTSPKKRILFVDDEKPVLDSLRRMLRSQRDAWEMEYVDRPEEAWELLLATDFDLLVSDVRMPGMNGLELLQRVRQTAGTREIPVVMLTGSSDRTLKRQALDLGAADLLNKPVEHEDLLARLRSVLSLKSSQDELKAHNRFLERKVQERTVELFQSRLDVVWRLGVAVDHVEGRSQNHVIRVACYSRVIAEAMGLGREFVEPLFLAAPLHDIGKIGIPAAIARKRGALTPAEQAVMEQHCLIGSRILRENPKIRSALLQWGKINRPEDAVPDENPLLDMAALVALTHHERWNGTGYPRRLAKEQLPLESRVIGIADALDTAMRDSPHAKLRRVEARQVIETVRAGAATLFCPDACAALADVSGDILSIWDRFPDQGDDPRDTSAPSSADDDRACRVSAARRIEPDRLCYQDRRP